MTATNGPNQPNSATIIRVVINVPLRRRFDYFLPPDYSITPVIGMRVLVPFGQQSKVAIIDDVIDATDYDSDISLEKIKPIEKILDEQPLVSDSLLALFQWICDYYHAPPGEVWQTLLPNELLKGKPAESLRQSYWQILPAGLKALNEDKVAKNAIKQKLALIRLKENSNGIAHESIDQFELNFATLKTLAGKKWITREFGLPKLSQNNNAVNQSAKIPLNDQQAKAVAAVSQSLGKFRAFLLFGVTASGKTEVYLQLIEKVIQNNQQALILVPEIGLTPQTLNRFKNRFNVNIVMLHSGLTDTQRLNSWLAAKNGDAQIIIGTRSALFTPMNSPGIIIIDEEHDHSFRQQQGFRYSARDVALVRANFEKIPVVLGSASPSFESLYNVERKKFTRLDLTEKAKAESPIKYRVIDLKKQVLNQGLSQELIKAISQHLSDNGQVLLFLNRRGYAPVLLCHECGWSSSCSRCDIHFTYHHQNHHLQCHHCGAHKRAPIQCPECRCDKMVPVGLGTERLEEAIRSLFPSAKVARIDRDTTRKKSAMDTFVNEIKSGQFDILVGTQMLAKGHHFPNLSLVGLIDMDGALYSADFRAPEFAAQLITQVSGRAGRASKAGEVIIQTHHHDHPMLQQIIYHGYDAFAQQALAERQEAELPPFSYSALIQAEANQITFVKQFLNETYDLLDRFTDLKVDLLGPCPALYAKKAGKFRYQLYLQSNSRKTLHRLLSLSLTDIEKLKSASRVRWRLEIDPLGES